MTADLLVTWIVPLSVTILMFGVGLNLSLTSLGATLGDPRSLVLALLLQIVLLPLGAFILVAVFDPAPLVALALVAISASPGGALSNSFTHLIGGNLALSLMMTTFSTSLVAATAPVAIAAALASGVLAQGAAARLDPVLVALDLLRIALVPIGVGVLVAHVLPSAARRMRRGVDVLGLLALATVLVGSAIVSFPALKQADPAVLLHAVQFSLLSLMLGLLSSRLLPAEDRSACVVQFGVRNLPVAVILASGGVPSAELVAFLFCYFLVNATVLVAVTGLARVGTRRVAA